MLMASTWIIHCVCSIICLFWLGAYGGGGAQGLSLAQCSRITPGGAEGTVCNALDGSRVGPMQ